MTLSNILKTAAVAGLMGLGLTATSTAPANAATYQRCNSYGCYRVHCDDRGYCYRTGGRDYYTDSDYYSGGYFEPYYDGDYYYRAVRVCGDYGCRWTRHREPRVHVGIGLRF